MQERLACPGCYATRRSDAHGSMQRAAGAAPQSRQLPPLPPMAPSSQLPCPAALTGVASDVVVHHGDDAVLPHAAVPQDLVRLPGREGSRVGAQRIGRWVLGAGCRGAGNPQKQQPAADAAGLTWQMSAWWR